MSDAQADANQRLTAFLEGLERLPWWRGIAWRGVTAGSGFGFTEPTVVTRGITAASRDPRVATAGFTTPGVYAILSQTGRDLGQFSAAPQEQEVVFAPGTLLQSQGRIEGPCPIVVVYELLVGDGQVRGPEVDPARLASDLQEMLDTARARGPIGPVRDRFAGEIW